MLYLFRQIDWSRTMIAMFYAMNMTVDVAARLAIWQSLKRMWKAGINQRNPGKWKDMHYRKERMRKNNASEEDIRRTRTAL